MIDAEVDGRRVVVDVLVSCVFCDGEFRATAEGVDVVGVGSRVNAAFETWEARAARAGYAPVPLVCSDDQCSAPSPSPGGS